LDNSTSINPSKKGNGRVLLITGCSGLGFNLAPHFGVYQLYNYLIQHGIMCDLYDRDLELNNWSEKGETDFRRNLENGVYDVVGISVAHDKVLGEQKMLADLDLLWRLRAASDKSDRNPLFIAGGQAATLNWKQWLKLGIDLIFLGFAEKSLYEVCKRIISQTIYDKKEVSIGELVEGIPGLAYQARGKEGNDCYVPAEPVTEELFKELFFELPQNYDMPYQTFWDLLENQAADNQMGGSEFIFQNVRIYSTSHCPFRCGFCNSQSFLPESITKKENLMTEREGIIFSKGKMRIIQLTAEDLGQLILYYINKYGAKSFLFSDDDFLVGSKNGLDRVREFCNIILNYKKMGLIPMGVRFSCQTRVANFLIGKEKTVDRELIQLMVDAGWLSCSLGIETFSNKMLKAPSINKIGITSHDCQIVTDVMIETGMIPQVNIILGIPEYTKEELMETVQCAVDYIKKGCDLSLSRQLLALPGAPIYRADHYELAKVIWTHPISGEEVEIPDYFIPEDTTIAYTMEKFDEAAQVELDRVISKMDWEDKIPAKRVIAVAALVGLGKLLNMPLIADELQGVLDGILTGEHSGLKDNRTKAVAGGGDLQKFDFSENKTSKSPET